jgi:ferric-dicitrate binding protein FerR (iron transport regulator)
MRDSNRTGILLFLHSRNELSAEEEQELRNWCQYSPENERLYLEMSDPEFLRNMMKEYYGERDKVFDLLKNRFPYLSATDFYNADDREADPAVARANEEKRMNFPDKDIAESGLSNAAFWSSLLEEARFSNQDELSENENGSELKKPGKAASSEEKRAGKIIRRILKTTIGVAASILITVVLFLIFGGSGSSSRFEASFATSDGFEKILDDYHRGFLDGYADISFGKTAKGERLHIFSGDRKAAKDKTYTLETHTGNEYILQLPDGTMVWMDPNSNVILPANFSSDTIRLKIEGKAYFETSGKKHLVITANPPSPGSGGQSNQRQVNNIVQIEPQADKFNVSAYPEDSAITINTISGTARISIPGQPEGQSLQSEPGKQILIIHGMASFHPAVDTAEILATKNGMIYLKDVSLQTILAAVANWYKVEIHSETEIPAGTFSLMVPLESKLSVIIDMLKKQGVHVVHQGKRVTVW